MGLGQKSRLPAGKALAAVLRRRTCLVPKSKKKAKLASLELISLMSLRFVIIEKGFNRGKKEGLMTADSSAVHGSSDVL
jgi:hypothetical protein